MTAFGNDRQQMGRIAALEAEVKQWKHVAKTNKACAEAAQTHVAALRETMKRVERLIKEALPKFDWGRSALDNNAIQLLNEVPIEVTNALATDHPGAEMVERMKNLEQALSDLWIGTMHGAGKAAVFESHKNVIRSVLKQSDGSDSA